MENIELLSSKALSSENFKMIYNQLHLITSTNNIIQREKDCITLIETIIEYLLHGDKSDPSILSTFADYNFITELLCLAHASNQNISLQIIKSFSLLITNLSNKDFLHYLLSNNFINKIISNNYENYDSDFLSYYVNFIKSLSLKINSTTIVLFFPDRFPLLDNALKLYNHHDPMINNVVRNIFLTIIKTKEKLVIDYVCNLPNVTYFIFLSCRLRDHIIFINDNLTVDNFDKIKSVYEDVVNDIIFFQDIFSLEIERFTYILTNSLFYYVILPLLSYTLITKKSERKLLSMNVCLNMILIFAFYINEEHFLNMLFATLFNEEINEEIMCLINNEPLILSNYKYEWRMGNNSQIKDSNSSFLLGNNKLTFQQFITCNFTKSFIESIEDMTKENYKEIEQIILSVDSKYRNKYTKNSIEVYKFILEQIQKYFSNEDHTNMIHYHRIVSISTGIPCGLAYDDYDKSPVHLYNKFWVNKSNSIKNLIRENLFDYFKCKEDTKLLYLGMIINIFLRKNKIISKELLSSAKMLPADDFIEKLKEISKHNFYDINSIDMIDDSYSAYYSNFNINEHPNTNNHLSNIVITLANYYLIPSKLLGEDDIVIFDSDYFQKNVQSTQSTYDQYLVSLILNIFELQIRYRPFTLLNLITILQKLIIKDTLCPFLDQQAFNHINLTYINSVFDITNILKQNKEVRSKCFSLFENEWKIYNSDLFTIIDSLLKEPYCLFPIFNEERLMKYPSILSSHNTPSRLYTMNLEIFMALHDLRCFIYQEWKTIKPEFPLTFSSISIEINQKLPWNIWNTQIFNCKLQINDVTINYSMFLKQNYLIFVSPDSKNPSYMIVKRKYPIRHLKFNIDKKEAKNLILTSKEVGVNITIIILLDNKKSAKELKDLFDDHRKNIESEEGILVDSYFAEIMILFKQYSE